MMITNRKHNWNQFLSSMKLPGELKNSVRPLDSLCTFIAKELKICLFNLGPVSFPHSCLVKIELVMKGKGYQAIFDFYCKTFFENN